MAEDIQLLANQLIYNGRLRCGSEAVRTQCLETQIPQDLEISEWRMKVAFNWSLSTFRGIWHWLPSTDLYHIMASWQQSSKQLHIATLW